MLGFARLSACVLTCAYNRVHVRVHPRIYACGARMGTYGASAYKRTPMRVCACMGT